MVAKAELPDIKAQLKLISEFSTSYIQEYSLYSDTYMTMISVSDYLCYLDKTVIENDLSHLKSAIVEVK